MNPHDETWMRRALQLAEAGRGYVEPNPLVGAVVVRDGKVGGEGWHQKFGEAQAAVTAIAAAGEAARGATLYVTLEPCCHHGKTPPCTDAIIKAGIARVVAALEDPFPQVAGRGASILKAAGIPNEFDVCAQEARRLNASYFKLLATGRPYVHAKWAMSVDGKIATAIGESTWISNEASRGRVHQLRGCMDGILVGAGTAVADDPMLTARPPGPRTACRVVLDRRGIVHTELQVVRTANSIPTLLVVRTDADADRFTKLGCDVLVLPESDGASNLPTLLDALGRRRWTNLLVEGGASVLGTFFDMDLVDEAHVFICPKVIGGAAAKSPVAGRGVSQLVHAEKWVGESFEEIDGDAYVRLLRKPGG